jgi:hypothetical protein
MSTSRSNSHRSKSAAGTKPEYGEALSSVPLDKRSSGAISKNDARQGGPFDHGLMIARPQFAHGGLERIHYGKQNVNRRHPPGGNQGGGDARQPG